MDEAQDGGKSGPSSGPSLRKIVAEECGCSAQFAYNTTCDVINYFKSFFKLF